MTLPDKLRWRLLSTDDHLLVAVSGGPDSLSLLHLLWTEREARGLGQVEAAHLDHGLRGEESAREADWMAAWCRERGIVCHLGEADTSAWAREHKESVQEAARAVRYEFLERTAASIGADKIVTGHTRDDRAETVLANILRGTGIDGLRGIPERRGLVVRPLLDVSRHEVEAYNAAHGLRPQQDPSNLSADHYTRNRIRLELLPQLRQAYNPRVEDALVRLSEIAARDGDYMAGQAQAALTAVKVAKDRSRLEMHRAALAALHPSLLRSVLRQAISEVRGTGQGISYEAVEASCAAITAVSGTWEKSGTAFALTLPHPACSLRVTRQTVILTRGTDSLARRSGEVSVPLTVPGTASLAGIEKVVWASWQDSGSAVRLDAGTVDVGSLHVRNRRAGDRVDPLGMGGRHKKLSDIFTDAKVPRTERDRIPIVADNRGIVWVVGQTISERAKLTPATTNRLYLSAQEVKPGEIPAGNSRGERE